MSEENTTSPAERESKPPAPGKRGGKRKNAGIVLILLIAAACIFGMRLWIKSKTHVETDNAFIESHVYSISSRVPGNVSRVMVRDNQFVRKGDLLLELDPVDYRLRVENSAAQLDMAKNETSGAYAQVDAAKAAAASDRARLNQADLDLARGRALFQREVIPKEQLDRLETARKVAAARLAESEGSVRKAQALLGLTGAGGRDAQIEKKRVELEEARTSLAYTKVYAPANGYITRKSVEQGNNIQAGQPLMALVALDEAWVTANYKESQLTHVRPGLKVEFGVDTYPGVTFRGKVDSIMAGTGASFSLLPPENATGNYVKVVQRIPVKILVDSASDPRRLLRVGMSVTPVILTDRKLGDILKDPFR